eukprot:TRINITY_DN5190_c0_g1_i1.p3 TRINITY_DN5190_c0_g1~~TRINITY_DN5190_c0_g1_i1.p3  ORF type:complete len:54 (-),score=6.09 TRINITY_DN5190_c0_g1_i1:14-175(-)
MYDPPCGCSAMPEGKDMKKWVATVPGPEGTPYASGTFYLDVKFGEEYPFKPRQ